jgi:hypothetical protein
MDQFWTIIFVVIIVTAFGLAHSHDCEDARCREYRYEVHDEEDDNKEGETAREKKRAAS